MANLATSKMLSKERRRRSRQADNREYLVGWSSGGRDVVHRMKSVDVSELGMRLESTLPIPSRSFVNFRAHTTGLTGSASVRYCAALKLRYAIGLEFSGKPMIATL